MTDTPPPDTRTAAPSPGAVMSSRSTAGYCSTSTARTTTPVRGPSPALSAPNVSWLGSRRRTTSCHRGRTLRDGTPVPGWATDDRDGGDHGALAEPRRRYPPGPGPDLHDELDARAASQRPDHQRSELPMMQHGW